MSTTFDAVGRPSLEIAPQQITSGFGSYQSFSLGSLPRTSYVYQNNGTTVVQNRSTTGVEASTSARTYGRRTTVVDAEGRSTVTEFDARGNTVKVTDPAGTTNYGYNLRDQVTSIIDAKNNLITTEYDDWELEPTRLDDPDLGVVDYSYDAAGRLEFQTDARGNRIGVVYDVLSRTEELKWCDAFGGSCTPGQTDSSFGYDAHACLIHKLFSYRTFRLLRVVIIRRCHHRHIMVCHCSVLPAEPFSSACQARPDPPLF